MTDMYMQKFDFQNTIDSRFIASLSFTGRRKAGLLLEMFLRALTVQLYRIGHREAGAGIVTF